MIALRSNCLFFQLTNGESIPCSAEMISIEIVGDPHSPLEPETLRHAAASVFHYFKIELEREIVTIGEFSLALEKVLQHLGYTLHSGHPNGMRETNLARLIPETGGGLELFFFPRLRDELRIQLRQSPRLVRFHGLRDCVKQITRARRWTQRCEKLEDQIVSYLRQCLTVETEQNECALVVA